MTKKLLFAVAILFAAAGAMAQSVTLPPSGDNYKSSVSQWIGIVKVTIDYNSPDVTGPNGQDRKGQIWGGAAYYGFIDQGFGTSKAAPWRAGANENTTISFSHDVTIGGKQVKAGKYGLFLSVQKEGPWTWIINSDAGSWGSYFYDPALDVVRVEANPQDSEYTEWLTFGFDDRQRHTAVAYLQWDTKRVGFRIAVPNTNELYVAKIRDDMRGSTLGFTPEPYLQAATFCAQNKVNLEQGLAWAEQAISDPFFGQENFASLSTKALVLGAMGREAETDAVMAKAIAHPTATVNQIHQYGRALLGAGKTQKAMEVFKLNAKKNPTEMFTPNVGLARGYAALGDKKNAIKYWEVAIKNLPANQMANKHLYEAEVKKLKEG